MGREYAHRRYGPTRHSLSITPTFANSWYAENENTIFDWDHVPAGILHDLIDDDVYNRDSTRGLNEANLVRDTVRGYNITTIYNYLDGSTGSPATLMNKLRNNLPAGNTIEHFDLLRSSYGY